MKDGLRWPLGGLFLWAGIIKVGDPSGFAELISGYQLGTYPLVLALAFYLPFLEIVCGAALMLNRAYAGALRILRMLMLIFIAALVCAWVRGLDIQCGCFGMSDGMTHYPWWLARDLLLLGGISLLIRQQRDLPPEGV
jgi:putative oxidoreductase